MIDLARDRKHRRAVQFGVVQAVEEMDRPRPGRREANAESARVFRVPAGHECGGLFVPHLHEPNLILSSPKRFHDAIDAVARQAEDIRYAPVNQPIDQ